MHTAKCRPSPTTGKSGIGNKFQLTVASYIIPQFATTRLPFSRPIRRCAGEVDTYVNHAYVPRMRPYELKPRAKAEHRTLSPESEVLQ